MRYPRISLTKELREINYESLLENIKEEQLNGKTRHVQSGKTQYHGDVNSSPNESINREFQLKSQRLFVFVCG